eukprot:TRINITY_DN30177_c0_g1_i1.p1 TRINITY_DN30177_c0_g1~~TRINITY_DN30177_c0_g1_i1.p1  ORF type:complete len:320 (-),score=72.08 TRINITY_DN30177_c0_g1_i1:208-1167(-)
MSSALAAVRAAARDKYEKMRGKPPSSPSSPRAGATASAASSAAAPIADASNAGARAQGTLDGAPRRLQRDDPSEQAAIEAFATSAEFASLVELLTEPGARIRGCQVDPARPKLQALQDILGWTQGGYDTRPTEEVQRKKQYDRLQLLLRYRQPPPPPPESGQVPIVSMYDYLCETIFAVPMRPVGPDILVNDIIDLDGNLVTPCWVEPDWAAFRAASTERPLPIFRPNLYPYQLPVRSLPESAPAYQRQTQHWILWYFHYPEEGVADPPDAKIDCDVRCALEAVSFEMGFESFDYIWYRNPGMSVPDMFHVQVFWIVPA